MYNIAAFYCQLAAGVKEAGLPDVKAALELARANGITGVDFSSKEITDTTAELLRSTDIHASSVHGFLPLNFKTDALYNESLAAMCDAIDKAISVGSPYFMSVPQPPKDMDEADRPAFISAVRAQFSDLCDYVKDKPITVTVEDFSLSSSGYGTFEDIDFLLNNNPTLMFTYDSGNFPLAGIDEVEGAKRYADRTVYVHLKDLRIVDETDPSPIIRMGKYFDSLELGGGYLKNFEALRVLKEAGKLDCDITVEINSSYDRLSRTLTSVKWLKEALGQI